MKVLMCAPAHYGIQYEINPWMKVKNATDTEKAQAQWEGLRRVLEHLGVTVRTVAQKKGSPDMVFTANAGVVDGKTFIPAHFRFRQRRAEEPAFIRYFRSKGYRIRDAAKGLFFEGEGDLLSFRDFLVGGFRFRSEIAALEKVADSLKKRLVAVELFTPRFYHLDTCFLPLDDHNALFYPGAFDRYGRKALQQFIANPISVDKNDAFQFACNGMRLGRTVVLNKASRTLKAKLEKVGYRVKETPTSEFMKAGGSVKCLLLKL